MHVPFLDLQAQYRSLKGEIDAAMQGVIDSTSFIGGEPVTRFEQAFGAWLGVPECIGCGNGTDSIEILLRAFGIGPGDEVIVPAHTWISTSEAVSNVGARPVFADTLPRTYVIDPQSVRDRVTSSTRAVIPVHLFGHPVQMDEILDVARRHSLKVIEDCAQAHGARWAGRKVGTIGDAASFSFYPGKNLGAYGDAGCMVVRDPEIARRARMLANHGQIRKHEHEIEGRNSRLDGLQAAVLGVKLPRLDGWNEARRRHARRYDQQLATLGFDIPPRPVDPSAHVFHIYAVEVADRARVAASLRDNGVDTAVHYPRALPELPAYRDHGLSPQPCPVASAACARVLSLPMYAEMDDDAVDFVCKQLNGAVQRTTAKSSLP